MNNAADKKVISIVVPPVCNEEVAVYNDPYKEDDF